MTIQDSVNALYKSGPKRVKLSDINARDSIGDKFGESTIDKPANTGGIASPLTEVTKTGDNGIIPDREYYAERTLTSTDGLLTFKVRDLKKLKMTDALENQVVFNFADPVNE